MGSTKLDQLMEEVNTLTPAEQRQLLVRLHRLLATPSTQQTEDALEQKLLKAGVIREIKPRITDFTAYQNRKPIEFTGKAVSEILMEDRR
jgi:hypothetical protein